MRCSPSANNRPHNGELSTDADEHENGGPLIRSEGHVALVYESDHAAWIERVGVENLLVHFATRAAVGLITRPCGYLDVRSLSAGSGPGRAGWTRRTGWTGGVQADRLHPLLAARFVRRRPRSRRLGLGRASLANIAPEGNGHHTARISSQFMPSMIAAVRGSLASNEVFPDAAPMTSAWLPADDKFSREEVCRHLSRRF